MLDRLFIAAYGDDVWFMDVVCVFGVLALGFLSIIGSMFLLGIMTLRYRR